ncbi:MAG: UTP--glucose-1-phosphate uridylyltransferase, partial [Zetaproteobacteria bacterium]
IHQFMFVTGRHKRAVEDHFDDAPELEGALLAASKQAALDQIQHIRELGEFAYVRQRKPLGLGHAVLSARAWIGNEPFAVLLADDLILGASVSATAQLLEVYQQTGCSVVGLMEVPESEVVHYGIAEVRQDDGRLRIINLVEKPAPDEAPSRYAVIGRYVLTPDVLALLADTPPGRGGEIQLTDALAMLARTQPVYGVLIEGERFDVGTPAGFLLANAVLALRDPRYRPLLEPRLRRELE